MEAHAPAAAPPPSPGDAGGLLRAENTTKEFGGLVAVNGVSPGLF